MGLFKKKKTPEELLAEGRKLYVQGDLKKAFLSLHKLAAQGNPVACYYIGRIDLEWKEWKLAQSFLTTAAKGGVSDAAALLAKEFGIRDYLPKETEPDLSQSESCETQTKDATPQPTSEPAAAKPKPQPEIAAVEPKPQPEPTVADPEPQPEVVVKEPVPQYEAPQKTPVELYWEAEDAFDSENYSEALVLFEKAARQGNIDSQFSCGMMYQHGLGTTADEVKGLYWYEEAGRNGHVYAQLECAKIYVDKWHSGEESAKAKALHWYEEAARQGNETAELGLAFLR